jgi:sulfide:quinone oxidoreductase
MGPRRESATLRVAGVDEEVLMVATAETGGTLQPCKVLIVGGGIAGIEGLMALADLGERRLDVTVVAAHPSFVLRPQIIGEPWGGEAVHLDLHELCRDFGATFVQGTVTAVDAARSHARTAAGVTIGYDRLLLAPGGRTALPYAVTRVIGFGALPHSLAAQLHGSVAIVVPPATTWTLPAYELALLTAARGTREVVVVTPEAEPVECFGPGVQAAVGELLARHGVRVDTGTSLPPHAELDDLAQTVIALPLVHGPSVAGVPVDADGFVRVGADMAVAGLEHVHAAGDATDVGLKQGGLAAQQAEVAATAIVRSCGGTPPAAAYHPVLRAKLTAATADGGPGEELYLRRALDGVDEGFAADHPLWQPPSIVCAWRLARWLAYRNTAIGTDASRHLVPHATS